MLNNSDEKLSQEARVIVTRLPNSVTLALGKTDQTNNLHKSPNYEDPKKKHTSRESDVPPAVKKEKKVFEVVDSKVEEFSKLRNSDSFSNFVKSENIIADSYKTRLPKLELSRIDTAKHKERFIKERKVKKETKESLKYLIESNISSKVNLRKRLHSRNNYTERKSQILNKVEPLIEIIPPVIKNEEPEIRIVKKIKHKDCNVGVLDKSEMITQNALTSFKIIHYGTPYVSDPNKPKKIIKSESYSIVEDATSNKGSVVSSHQTLEIPETFKDSLKDPRSNCIVEDAPAIKGAVETSHQPLENPETLKDPQKQDLEHEQAIASLDTDSTIRSKITSNNLIKVKAPQVLGIQNQDVSQSPHNMCPENRFNITQLRQIRSTSGSQSRIEEICKVYPIFFTPEARCDISVLIQILHKTSRGLRLEQIKSSQYDKSCLLNIQNCSKKFVETFIRIIKQDEIGLDKDLLKKIVPILYLHIDKAFKSLRPNEDFDFRIIMKKIFEVESFVCDHDVILEKNYEMFKKVMNTFDRWLADIFIECDLSDTVEPVAVINNVEDNSLSLSAQFSPDSLEDTTSENDHLTDPTANTTTQDITMCGADVEPNYLQCSMCREALPMCCLCKELLSCPCLSDLSKTLAFNRGPGSLTFCREHAKCGDNWPQWLEDWVEERENPINDMPFNPICWNESCNNKAELLCVCRIQAYCSRSCQLEDWYEEHHRFCRRGTDPSCYFTPQEGMDVS